ncbi:single-stranded DNA-binding protein [Phascolarctobacterium sp.]|uniref:single-stranded DNA-binding protein n=1 Tax=Phascolarctobacterium sp. TaxID=2049039 RepID=UPI00386FE68F
MLNHVVLMGRLTRDVEVRYSQGSNMAIGRFTLAVERDYKKEGEERAADFVSCVAFGKTAEFISQYFGKGSMIAVTGSIQTGSYTNQEGQKVYTTEVKVDKASFTGEKRDDLQQSRPQPQQTPDYDGFMNVPDGIDEELPFD